MRLMSRIFKGNITAITIHTQTCILMPLDLNVTCIKPMFLFTKSMFKAYSWLKQYCEAAKKEG